MPRRGFGDEGGAVAAAGIEWVDRIARGGVGKALRPEQPGTAGQQLDLVRARRAGEALAGHFEERFLAAPEPEELGLARGRV